MNESGDPLAWFKSQRIEHPAIIGVPFRDPGRPIAEGMGRVQKGHASRARRKHLLPFGDLHVRLRPGDNRDHERRPSEAVALERGLLGTGVRIVGSESGGDRVADPGSRRTLEDDEPPGDEAPMIRHPEATRRSVSIS